MISAIFNKQDLKRTTRKIAELDDKMKQAINRAISFGLIETERLAKGNVTRNKSVNTGQLRAKIANVHRQARMEGETVSRQTYSSAVEYGRKPGSFPPLAPIERWVRLKGLAGTFSTRTRRRTGGRAVQARQDRAVAYVIARKIFRKGIQPKPFLQPAFDDVKPRFRQRYTSEIKKALK